MGEPRDNVERPFAERKETIHAAFAEALRADREAFNQRFALRRRGGARIDGAAFQEHLETTVNALVRCVAEVQPERVRAVVQSLFDVSLDLFAAGLLGPNAKHPHVRAAWRELLPCAAKLLAREPTRVAGSVSNAIEYLAANPSGRPREWMAGMRNVSQHCDTVPHWLDAGKVLAWRAGLVQFRNAGLEVAGTLPWKLAARCFDVPEDGSESDWRQLLQRMHADRWFAPAATKPEMASATVRIVRKTGGFRGFGGPCLRPPKVTANDAGLFVVDGDNAWQLLADVFGTLWRRVPGSAAKTSAPASPVAIDECGNVSWEGIHPLVELAEANSRACDGQTLAVTLPTSYHVYLVARAT